MRTLKQQGVTAKCVVKGLISGEQTVRCRPYLTADLRPSPSSVSPVIWLKWFAIFAVWKQVVGSRRLAQALKGL